MPSAAHLLKERPASSCVDDKRDDVYCHGDAPLALLPEAYDVPLARVEIANETTGNLGRATFATFAQRLGS